MSPRGGEGPQVTFVRCDSSEALGVVDDRVDTLFDEGWEARDVALLTVGARHPYHRDPQESMGFQRYWDMSWDGSDIFSGHVLGFKGMERRAVVLCVNESAAQDRGPVRLYVGMSRATGRLIVVRAPDVIERMGGTQVRERLEAGEVVDA